MKPILLLLLSVCICAAEVPVQNEKLPNDVVALLNSYDKDMAKIKNDAEVAMSVRTEKLRPALIKAQEAATKKGNLEAAMAIKAEVEKLAAPEKPKVQKAFQGSYDYSYTNGHKGVIVVTDDKVLDTLSGTAGTWVEEDKSIILTWSNNTKWVMKASAKGTYTSLASDGNGVLTPKK